MYNIHPKPLCALLYDGKEAIVECLSNNSVYKKMPVVVVHTRRHIYDHKCSLEWELTPKVHEKVVRDGNIIIARNHGSGYRGIVCKECALNRRREERRGG